MSAYGHQMEREYSAQSLSSTGDSEMGSRYTTETGIYMSSFAAMVFISGLVTVGVSMMALLISLAVMLQSSLKIQACKLLSRRDFNFPFPWSYCRPMSNPPYQPYSSIVVNEGKTNHNLVSGVKPKNSVIHLAGSKLQIHSSTTKIIKATVPFCCRIDKDAFHDSSRVKNVFAMKLYLKLQAGGWPLILISRKPEKLRDDAIEHLASVGCSGWSSLIMRTDSETQMDSQKHFSRQRTALQNEGFRIIATISSQMDAVRGPCLEERIFKLPTPMFSYKMEDNVESTNL
ncbi:uncharacterized protein At2g39920-like [Olea europaea var. sylvestris]|uniref:uncharacterized protein At2g39920-like n=1 Tax=Olea europaea var. sylvestris TaxID=158386 RepID=UPI000C1D111B|nr:uncharacterized protein At2g39920-like [Olea europaea var. sylvestris]